MTYISVGLRILLSIAFLGAGGAKLARCRDDGHDV